MNKPIRVVVHGAAGRMGRSVLRIAAGSTDVEVVAALVREGKREFAGTRGGPYATHLESGLRAEVIVDFSGASGLEVALEIALEHKIALVSGSTGLSEAQHSAIAEASRTIPVLWAANFSLGVAVLAHLAAEAARLLPSWDCEIIEAHHRLKVDAPSGTALALGRRINAARGRANNAPGSDRSGQRDPGAIGYCVSRSGDIIGEHEVRLAGEGERLELIHRAGDRDLFARGALASARWIVGKPCGLYEVSDVLGFRV